MGEQKADSGEKLKAETCHEKGVFRMGRDVDALIHRKREFIEQGQKHVKAEELARSPNHVEINRNVKSEQSGEAFEIANFNGNVQGIFGVLVALGSWCACRDKFATELA